LEVDATKRMEIHIMATIKEKEENQNEKYGRDLVST